jgi:hypothetical protein
MGRCRFVQPETVRLSLSEGDWLEVKRELNAGEARQVQIRLMSGPIVTGEKITYDPAKVGLTQALEYIVAWSFLDTTGKVAEISEASLKLLDQDSLREVIAAVNAHDAEQDARREADRKNRSGARGLQAVS